MSVSGVPDEEQAGQWVPAEVSVVIPALNEERGIGASIDSAWENQVGQVIVCDGGSDDATVDAAERHRAVVVRTGPGRGNQLAEGVRLATGRLYLFLHADNRLAEDAVATLCRRWAGDPQPLEFWGGFRQTIDRKGLSFRLLEAGNAARIRLRGMPFGDQAVFVTAELYAQSGGFQRIPLMEDVALARLLRARRWPALIDARVIVDSRRWDRRGVIRQTLRNWMIQSAHAIGVSEERLSHWYR